MYVYMGCACQRRPLAVEAGPHFAEIAIAGD